MRASRVGSLLLALLMAAVLPIGCRRQRSGGAFVIALGDNIRTIDPIGSPSVDAASERVRTLMFNSLVRKDEKFDYVGELASDIKRSDDNLTFTFTLREGVKFHDGRTLTSADAKYTLDLVFSSTFAKSASFYEGSGAARQSYIKSVEAPDAKTLVITTVKPWTGLLSNLVPISIIPKDGYATQKDHPLGTDPFKFKSYDTSQQVVDLEANPDYWEGPTHLQQVRVRVIPDTNALQAELRSGRVHIAPLPPVETVQWWGGGPYYDYYAPGYGYGYGWNPGGNVLPPGYAPAPGYERGYEAGAADVAACMERFRSYDPVSRTYMGRDRRRHPCPL